MGPPTFDSYPDRRRDPSLSRPQPVRSSVHPLVVRTYLRPTDGLTSRPERSSCKSKEVSATLVAPSIIVPLQANPPFFQAWESLSPLFYANCGIDRWTGGPHMSSERFRHRAKNKPCVHMSSSAVIRRTESFSNFERQADFLCVK